MEARARTVVLDTVAQDSVDSACDKWEGAEQCWRAIEWALCRDPFGAGVAMSDSGKLRALHYDGARSINQPDVDVIYEVTEHAIIIKDAVFTDAKATRAGYA